MKHSTKKGGHGSGRSTMPAAFSDQDYGRYCVGILCSEPYQTVSDLKFNTKAEASAELDRLQPLHKRSLSVGYMPTPEEQADYAVKLQKLIAADRRDMAGATA